MSHCHTTDMVRGAGFLVWEGVVERVFDMTADQWVRSRRDGVDHTHGRDACSERHSWREVRDELNACTGLRVSHEGLRTGYPDPDEDDSEVEEADN